MQRDLPSPAIHSAFLQNIRCRAHRPRSCRRSLREHSRPNCLKTSASYWRTRSRWSIRGANGSPCMYCRSGALSTAGRPDRRAGVAATRRTRHRLQRRLESRARSKGITGRGPAHRGDSEETRSGGECQRERVPLFVFRRRGEDSPRRRAGASVLRLFVRAGQENGLPVFGRLPYPGDQGTGRVFSAGLR